MAWVYSTVLAIADRLRSIRECPTLLHGLPPRGFSEGITRPRARCLMRIVVRRRLRAWWVGTLKVVHLI